MARDWSQIRALLYKEYLIHKKNYVTTFLIEFGLPLLMCFAFLVIFPAAIESRVNEYRKKLDEAASDRKVNASRQMDDLKDAFDKNRTLLYAPDNEDVNRLMSRIDSIFDFMNISIKSESCDTVDNMTRQLKKMYDLDSGEYFARPVAAIAFNQINEYPNRLNYTIWPSYFYSEKKLFINIEESSASFDSSIRHFLPNSYLTSGFLYLQSLLNMAFIYDAGIFPVLYKTDVNKTNSNQTDANQTINVDSFAKLIGSPPIAMPAPQIAPSLLDDPVLITPGMLFSVVHTISFLPMIIFIKRILDEKSSKMTELLRLMSMRERNYWLTKWIFYGTYFVCMNSLVALLLWVSAKGRINISLYFVFSTTYCLSAMFFSSALSTFFGRPISGIAAYVGIQVFNAKPLWRYLKKPGLPDGREFQGDIVLSDYVHFLMGIILGPNYSSILFCLMLFEAAGYEYSSRRIPRLSIYTNEWKNLFQVPPEYQMLSLGLLLLALMLSGVLWLLCLWYFSQVWPSEESTVRPFYFPFQRLFHSKNDKVAVDGHQNGNMDTDQYFEKDPKNLVPAISVRGVSKRFDKKNAVINVNLRVYVGQITVLLGHNGAGKTTLIQMITGLIPPTQGEIYVGGKSVQANMYEARRRIGYCPQHTILYNDMTVEEHLYFFGTLKGFSRKDMPKEIDRVLELLELVDKRWTKAKNLSGGMKKKLQMAGAIMGSSNILILDEPSSGLDIEARRMIWDILISLRKTYMILLTTHHMEEADCLGDRVAIMYAGELKCCGSPAFLKQAFGVGYNLTVVKSGGDSEKIKELIKKHIQPLAVETETSNEVVFNVAQSKKRNLATILEDLEQNLDNVGAISFSLRIHSIDSVFLKATTLFDQNDLSDAKAEVEIKYLYNGEDYKGLDRRRFKALLRRRWQGIKRGWLGAFALFMLSLAATAAFYIVLNQQLEKRAPIIEEWYQDLSLDKLDYKSPKGFCSTFNDSNPNGFCEDYSQVGQSYGVQVDTTDKKPEVYLKQFIDSDFEVYIKEHLIGASREMFKFPMLLQTRILQTFTQHLRLSQKELIALQSVFINSPRGSPPKAYYNPRAFHSGPVSLNLMYNKIAREWSPNMSIHVSIHTLTYENQELALQKLKKLGFDTYIAILILMFGFILATPYPSLTLTKERITKAKYILQMSGVQYATYWLSNFVFDACLLFLVFLPFWFLPPFLGRNLLYNNTEALFAFILAFIAFVCCSVVLTYVISSVFNQPSTVYAFIIIPSFISAAVLNFVIMLLKMLPQTEGAYEWYEQLFINIMIIFCHLCPFWLFTDVAFKLSRTTNSIYLCEKYNQDDLDAICGAELDFAQVCCSDTCQKDCFNWNYKPFTFDETGIILNLMLLLVTFVVCILILWWMEFKKTKRCFKGSPEKHLTNTVKEDSDVIEESKRVDQLVATERFKEEAFIAHDLTMIFKKTVAVSQVSFTVHKRECFGLLGFNGAGKTTTFRMIVGEILPSIGNSYVGQLSRQKDYSDYVRQIGYCPQFDIEFFCLTGREILTLFADIRGIPEPETVKAVNQIISLVDLDKYADTRFDYYSGGNKRKLSLGVALIGSPYVIVLDEPSAGVDPVARRKLWKAIDIFRTTSNGSIIFSSHTMDECEALCDRLVIMKKGHLQCIGSPQYLKTRFSKGYTLFVKLSEDEDLERFLGHLRQVFPSGQEKDIHQRAITYHIKEAEIPIASVFKTMEAMETKFKIEDYTVSNTSLEDIFLSFNKPE